MKKVEDKILDLLVDICGTKKVKKNLQLDLIQEGYLDSMGVVSLLSEIEEEFEVEIPLETFNPDDFCTAEKIIKYIKLSVE
ncbi:D-alanine--poly(phosphoribitol) ligase subunit DltC [Blautia difficilis]|uniref:D-alanine--poly(Phosphoribitol) ligase subunit DltC n=1 Tax=Blautia difficilis TaxID=2763027 RepID=A0ABR7IMA9_9FIRM|nr:D-alanine--poly(phosphoribitol) ligase subunit DltC [Blautia difficilis]MBC5781089.1 D-alanine--poly(phosphoribitol) ligase subunit DltC [Blautia difficilis]